MHDSKTDLLEEVATYYAGKLSLHGETPRGVDWNGPDGQILRFEQLCKVIGPTPDGFSLNDLGCGYGALLEFLRIKYPAASYCGVDIAADMVRSAQRRHADDHNARFIKGAAPDAMADFGVASGIFNVRMNRAETEWFDYVQATLDILDRTSRSGFAFNCLTSFADEHKKRSDLYYADPCLLFGICRQRYSPQVALLHDYGLYEFTVLVRKP